MNGGNFPRKGKENIESWRVKREIRIGGSNKKMGWREKYRREERKG